MKTTILSCSILAALAIVGCSQAIPTEEAYPTTAAIAPTIAESSQHPTEAATPIIVPFTPAPEETSPPPGPEPLATAPYRTGSVPVIEQAFDNKSVRGEEPWDMALSPDGKTGYVLGSETDNLFAVNLETNQIRQVVDLWPATPFPLGPAPRHIAITPDGAKLALMAANDSSLLLLTTEPLSVTKRIPLPQWPQDLIVSPDGKRAVALTASPDTMLVVVDMQSGKVLQRVRNPPRSSMVHRLAFSPDGDRLYVATQDGGLAIFDGKSYQYQGAIPLPPGRWTSLQVTRDGKTAYLSGMDTGKVHKVDLAAKKVAASWDVALANGLALSPDERRLYVTTFGFLGHAPYKIVMLDAHTGEVLIGADYIHPAPYGRAISDIKTILFSPDGRALYLPSVDGDGLLLADAETLEAKGFILLSALAEYMPYRMVLSPQGRTLYVANRIPGPPRVSVIDVVDRKLVGEIVGEQASCPAGSYGLDISPDGERLYVLASDARCVLIADTQARRFVDWISLPKGDSTLRQIVISPDGKTAYIADMSGLVSFLDLKDKRVQKTVPTGVEQAETLKLSPDGKQLFLSGGYSYAVISPETGEVVHFKDYSKEGEWARAGRAIAFLPKRGQYTITDHFGIRVYDWKTHREAAYINLLENARPILPLTPDMRISPDGKTAYLAEWDEKAVIAMDTDTWQVTARIDTGRMPFSCLTPRWLQLSPDGEELYVACEEADRVTLLDTESNAVIGVIRLDE